MKRQRRRPVDPAAVDAELATALHSLRDARNYADWIHELVEPHLGRRVLEVGAGHGDLTERLRRSHDVLATDTAEGCLAVLRERFAGADGLAVRYLDATAPPVELAGSQDAVVAVNVVEHLGDDVAALAALGELVRPGGSVVVFVPAFDALYSEFDRRVGHHRRYTRGRLLGVLAAAGLEAVEARYVNSLGALAWWLLARQLRQTPTRRWSVRTYDRLAVPVLRRLERRYPPPFGQSVLGVARRPRD